MYVPTSKLFYDLPELSDRESVVSRHGVDHSVPPHLISYRVNISALKTLSVSEIVAINVVGGFGPEEIMSAALKHVG